MIPQRPTAPGEDFDIPLHPTGVTKLECDSSQTTINTLKVDILEGFYYPQSFLWEDSTRTRAQMNESGSGASCRRRKEQALGFIGGLDAV